MSLPYTALVTPEEVRKAAFATLGDALGDEIEGALGDLYDGVVEAIRGATWAVESYLHRDLIIRAHTLRFCAADWTRRAGYENADAAVLWSAHARQWPVVEVVSVDDDAGLLAEVTLQAAHPGGQLLSYDPDSTLITEAPYSLACFAGYRRADQGVGAPGAGDPWTEDLTDPGGANLALSVTTADIPALPHDIRRCALRLATADIREQMLGLVGVADFRKQVERMTVEGRSVDTDLTARELARLHRYRHLA